MSSIQVLFTVISAIILFLYALSSFSRELQGAGGNALRSYLTRVTSSRWKAFLFGAAATAVVQSSSAVTALAVALVDASVLTFRASLGVLLGANVGTTATAWLVSSKLTGIGPIFIVLGAATSAFARAIVARTTSTDMAVVWAHLVFNMAVAVPIFVALPWLEPVLARRLRAPARPPEAAVPV